jgi:hypothetical protein
VFVKILFGLLVLSSASFAQTPPSLPPTVDANIFFQQFLNEQVQLEGSDKVWYRSLTSDTDRPTRLPNGNYVISDLYLSGEGRFIFTYKEMILVSAGVFFHRTSEPKARLDGNWGVEGTHIILKGLAVGEGILTPSIDRTGLATQEASLSLNFLTDVGSPGLKGQSLILQKGLSNWGPADAKP